MSVCALQFWRRIVAEVTASLPLVLLEELGLPCVADAWTLSSCRDFVLDVTAGFGGDDDPGAPLPGAASAIPTCAQTALEIEGI